jgi:hypothetical protein
MLNHAYDHRLILARSQRINWKLEEVIGGRTFHFSRPLLPNLPVVRREFQSKFDSNCGDR